MQNFESINKIPKNKLLASLTSDITSISMGFGSIPEALQGAFILISTLGYIAYLSPGIGILVMLCLAVMIVISFYFMKRTYTYFSRHRLGKNTLYKDYSECIEGQKKRLALINALLENRSLLLLDEWATNQDPNFKAIFYNEILPYLNSLGFTIILISHDGRYFYAAQKIYEIKNEKIKI
ncbi:MULTISPECIES: hypothetical protein [Campylobacter]|uniref:hypothetical protein n=1 Tax=Campylobacter TaxID=194 RepID=UPI000A3476C4|nr:MULTISPECIES: hypothetical protein [unclassified Campylobacter]MCR8678762.1 hypothetical protein [Campylobacter sp. RM19072]MCR8696277.1 hypothetical protein [Campylobacter sp. RM19073]